MIRHEKKDRSIYIILFLIFILTEIIDDVFDHILGSSIIHSVTQFILFMILLFIVAKLFLQFHKKKLSRLIPQELMDILKTIQDQNSKGVLINQAKLMKILNVTKPTMKKRLNQLIYLEYIQYETNGNNKFLMITHLGKSIIK
jgi:DNA-binding MarR family transcriptional regulator